MNLFYSFQNIQKLSSFDLDANGIQKQKYFDSLYVVYVLILKASCQLFVKKPHETPNPPTPMNMKMSESSSLR